MQVTHGKRWVWARAAGAIAATLVSCGPAQAFYWHDWPGSRVLVQQSVITQQHQNPTANPPTSTPPASTTPEPGSPRTPPPPIGPPIGGDKPPIGPPEQTPEPATALLGVVGLGALAAVRGWRKRK